MNTPDTCWLFAANYTFNVKATATGSFFATFKEMYDNTVGNKVNGSGALLKDQVCISPEMQAWRPKIYGRTMGIREMTGYPTESTGYPANMQPALAYAVDSGYTGAKEAWDTYETRDASQRTLAGYGSGPQFSIVPRSIAQTVKNNGLSVVINRPDLENPNPITPPVTPPVTPPPSGTGGTTTPPPVTTLPGTETPSLKQVFLIKGERTETA